MTAHWGVREPAAVAGARDQIARAFREAFLTLDRRITLFLSLPLSSISRLALKKEIEHIGRQ
jgi:arsenate reductase (thioredoxin)